MNQVRSWCGILLAGWLLAGFVPAAHSGLFTDFGTSIGSNANGEWEQLPVGTNNGGASFTGTGDAAVLTLRASSVSGSDSYTYLQSIDLTSSVTVSFHWTLTANGNDGTPLAYYNVGGNDIPLVYNPSKGQYYNITVSGITQIAFELVGNVSPGKAAAQLGITEVPEAGNALAGLLVLGTAGFEWFRRKRTAGG